MLPTVSVGVPEAELIVPAPSSDPAVRLKPAKAMAPDTIRLPVVISVFPTSVTECPEATVTLFPAPGTTPFTQVAPSFQLPEVADVIVVWACTVDAMPSNASTNIPETRLLK